MIRSGGFPPAGIPCCPRGTVRCSTLAVAGNDNGSAAVRRSVERHAARRGASKRPGAAARQMFHGAGFLPRAQIQPLLGSSMI